jgi:hypothetical protein
VPELEQWNGEFWRPNREFFSKNREFSAKIESSTSGATRKSVGRSRRLRDARPPTRSSLPHDRSTARPGRFRRLAIAGGPRAFHPAAQPSIGRPLPISRGHTSLFSPPWWSWGSVPPRKRPLCDGHHIRRGRTAHSLLQSHSWMGGDSKEIIRALKLRNACALEDDEVAN